MALKTVARCCVALLWTGLACGCGAPVTVTLPGSIAPVPVPPVTSTPGAPVPVAAPPATPPPVAGQAGTATIAPQYVAVGAGGTVAFTGAITGPGSIVWLVNGVAGGNASVGVVDSQGHYTAPASLSQSQDVLVTVLSSSAPQTEYATAVVSLIATGVVSGTANPQVASYTIYLPAPGTVQIKFGQTASDGLMTWVQGAPTQNGGQVTILVAGMLANSTYHMQAQVALADGATFTDSDHTFATGTPPVTSTVTTTVTGSDTPQPGIEMFDTLLPFEPAQAFATDLKGNVIWTYSYPGTPQDAVQPIKMLPNGHFMVVISYASSIAIKGGHVGSATLDELREVDLAGTTIRSVTETSLAAALAAQGYDLQLGSLHHDVLPLPNGHTVVLASVSKSFSNLTGYPGTTVVQGDLVIDLDQNFKPDWVWNAFDHLDVNRHPLLFPDWTHANALLYSSDDHNLLISLRHQDWILKLDFNDGTGTGNVIWRLGEGGDFQLKGGTDPTDWFYAQHGPGYFSTNTTGTFSLGVMDNGNARQFAGGATCVVGGNPACYSAADVLQVDEATMTAQLVEHYLQPAGLYSFFGGDVRWLANGDLEADFCADNGGSQVDELRGFEGAQQVVWQAVTPGSSQYRAERLPSLYPGVQW